MANYVYSPVVLGMFYVAIREKYFAKYTTNYFNPLHFERLAKFLEKENINPQAYMNYVFGILEYKIPPTPAKLANPILVQKFRSTIKDEAEITNTNQKLD